MKAIKRIFLIGLVLSLLGLNVATIVSATTYNALYSLLSHVPIPSLFDNSIKQRNEKLTTKNKTLKQKNRKLTADIKGYKVISEGFVAIKLHSFKKTTRAINRIQSRIAKSAVANVAAIPFESIPIFGIATIITATGFEVYWSCQNMKDLDAINAIIDSDNATAQSNKVCGLQVPTIKEIKNKIGL